MYSLKNSDNDILCEKQDIKKKWQTYIEHLFEDNKTHQPQIPIIERDLPILKPEIEHVIKQTESNKPGQGQI